MSDKMTKQQRSRCMSHIRSKSTTPEIVLRKELFRRGFRFRKNVSSLPGTPDIVLPKYRTCIFVNGCFWHGHRGCRHYTIPKTNADFWKDKIRRNIERDAADVQNLEVLSWNVITVWECELKPKLLAATVGRVADELLKNGRNGQNTENYGGKTEHLQPNRHAGTVNFWPASKQNWPCSSISPKE